MHQCTHCGKEVRDGEYLEVVLNNQVTRVICKNCDGTPAA